MNARRLALDDDGWLDEQAGCQRCLSPNHDARPAGTTIDLLVIHNISLPPGEFGGPAILQLFQNALDTHSHPSFASLQGLRVSAHFLIRRNGPILQFVPTTARAWHAGASLFQGRSRCNDFSIGIELEGTDTLPYTDFQYAQLGRLSQALRQRHPIRWVRGHEHIAPGRKTDPGPAFDWARLGRLAGWPDDALPAVAHAPRA